MFLSKRWIIQQNCKKLVNNTLRSTGFQREPREEMYWKRSTPVCYRLICLQSPPPPSTLLAITSPSFPYIILLQHLCVAGPSKLTWEGGWSQIRRQQKMPGPLLRNLFPRKNIHRIFSHRRHNCRSNIQSLFARWQETQTMRQATQHDCLVPTLGCWTIGTHKVKLCAFCE